MPVEHPELNEPFFCNLTYAANQSHLVNPDIQAYILQDNNSCTIRTRLELMRRYWESLDDFSQNLLKSYKKTFYTISTPAGAKYSQLSPEDRIKKIIDRNYDALKQNKEARDKIIQNHPEITKLNTRYLVANMRRDKLINTLVSKPDILFLLNKIVVNAPFFPKAPLTLYRGMKNGKYTEEFYKMKVNEIYTLPNIASTSSKPEGALTFISYPEDDFYAPVLLKFELDENYPRFDYIYLEGCIQRNDESEYLLPMALKKTADTNVPVYLNNEYTYTSAKWICTNREETTIKKVLAGQGVDTTYLITDSRATRHLQKGEDGRIINNNNMVVITLKPYIKTSEQSNVDRTIQNLWNKSFRAPSGKEMRKQAEENSRKAMENYSARPMSQKALREQAESNSRMARYNLTQKRNGTAIRTDPFVKALGKYNIRTRKNRRA